MELNQILATLRKARGLSQLELAEAVQVSRQAVSKWEVGTSVPSVENLKCLSELYQIPIDNLLFRVESSSRAEGSPKHEISAAPEKPVKHTRPGLTMTLFLLAAVILIYGRIKHATMEAIIAVSWISLGMIIYWLVTAIRKGGK